MLAAPSLPTLPFPPPEVLLFKRKTQGFGEGKQHFPSPLMLGTGLCRLKLLKGPGWRGQDKNQHGKGFGKMLCWLCPTSRAYFCMSQLLGCTI